MDNDESKNLNFQNPSDTNRWLLEELDAISSYFTSFQSNSVNELPSEKILEECIPLLMRLAPFEGIAFSLVDEQSFEFKITVSSPAGKTNELNQIMNDCVDNGIFSWSINQNRLIEVPLKNSDITAHLHVLATRNKILGMFIGITKSNDFIPDATKKFISIIMMNCANSIESSQLYNELNLSHQKLEEKIQERTINLIESEKRAREANDAKTQFLSNTSHEIRTPLNAIIGYSEMLLEDLAETDHAPDIQKIISAARHQLSIINDILDFSKFESGEIKLDPKETEIKRLIAEVINLTKPLCTKNENSFEVLENVADTIIWVDDLKLKQILINIISNAAKFTQKGKISFECQISLSNNNNANLTFIISDTGIGIPKEKIKIIFEPFKQVDTSTYRRYGGTGLGLALCKAFCDMMKGSITLVSEENVGTVFTITIPCKTITT